MNSVEKKQSNLCAGLNVSLGCLWLQTVVSPRVSQQHWFLPFILAKDMVAQSLNSRARVSKGGRASLGL